MKDHHHKNHNIHSNSMAAKNTVGKLYDTLLFESILATKHENAQMRIELVKECFAYYLYDFL